MTGVQTCALPICDDAANYALTQPAGITVDITPVALTVTAADKSKTYDGTTFTAFSSTITGFVNSETESVITGSVTYTGSATTAVNAGSSTHIAAMEVAKKLKAIAAEMLRPYVRPDVVETIRNHQHFQGRHYYQHFGMPTEIGAGLQPDLVPAQRRVDALAQLHHGPASPVVDERVVVEGGEGSDGATRFEGRHGSGSSPARVDPALEHHHQHRTV